MHSDKSNTFYLEHAQGAHLFELHQKISAQIDLKSTEKLKDWLMEPDNTQNNNKLFNYNDINDPCSHLENWLKLMGRGVEWTLSLMESDPAGLEQLRKVHARRLRFGRRLCQSPLLPESVFLLAHKLASFTAADYWAILDDDHHLAWALKQNKRKADAYIMEVPQKEARLEGLAPSENIFWDQNWLQGKELNGRKYQGVFIDSLHADNMLSFALQRAVGLLDKEGLCALLLHPWQRKWIDKIESIIGLSLIERCDEIAMRYQPHFVSGEIPWDLRIYAASEQMSSLDQEKTYKRAYAKDLDPTSNLTGAGTFGFFGPQIHQPESVEQALSFFEKCARIKILNRQKLCQNSRTHHILTLAQGGQIALTVQPDQGTIDIDCSPWRPRLMTQISTALFSFLKPQAPVWELP